MKAQLTAREERPGESGPYWVTKWVLDDGKKRTLTTFAPFAKDLELERWYEVETKTNDKGFTNLVGAKAIEAPATTSAAFGNGSHGWAPDGEREGRIIRGNAANAAAALLAPSLALEPEPVEAARRLIVAAEIIAAYIRDGALPEPTQGQVDVAQAQTGATPRPQSHPSQKPIRPDLLLRAVINKSGYPGGLEAFLKAEAPDLITEAGGYAASKVTAERAEELITLCKELRRLQEKPAEEEAAQAKAADELPFE